jgi:hypothetical protein
VRIKRTVIVLATAVLAGCGWLAAVQPGGAQAAAAAGLPITNVFQIVADTAHGHLFISQGPASGVGDSLLVTNLSGSPVGTLAVEAAGLALSPDDTTLYAAAGDAVIAVSTTTLKVTATYPLPSGDTAYEVAVQSGRLWVSYPGGIGEINPASVDSFTPDAVPGTFTGDAPQIAVDPSDTGVLVAATTSADPQTTATYNVSDPSAVAQIATETSSVDGCGYPNGLSVLPGGTVFLCGGIPYSVATLAMQDSPSGAADFTAVAADGAIAAGDSGLTVLAPGAATPTDQYGVWQGISLPSSFINPASAPVAFGWSADGTRLFTVVESTSLYVSSPLYSILTLYPFERVPADLTIPTTATAVSYGHQVTVSPHLGFTYSNINFSFYMTPAGMKRQLIWVASSGPGAGVTTTTSPTRNVTFTAVFTGDARYLPTTVTLEISVGVKITTALSGYYKSTSIGGTEYRVYHHTATLKDAVTVAPDHSGECVRLQVQEYSHGAWRADTTAGCEALSKTSHATLTRKLGATGRFRVRADFVRAAKDTTNASTDGSWLYYEVTR